MARGALAAYVSLPAILMRRLERLEEDLGEIGQPGIQV